MTFGPQIFVLLAKAIQTGRAVMTRREPQDKEFFVQDWIEKTLKGAYIIEQQGRNSHPDYVLKKKEIVEGLEIKSLENARSGRRDTKTAPCRTDVDFNSCIPCGKVKVGGNVLRCYYAFVLYEKIPRSTLKVNGVALALADGNFLNRDFDLAVAHTNTSESGFGSYGDAFVRTRKMYRFPNPLTFPAFRYRTVFVTEDIISRPEDMGLKSTESVTKTGRDGRLYRFQVYELA